MVQAFLKQLKNLDEILEACRKGSEKAQLSLFRIFATQALRTAWRYVKNEDDAREVMQLSMIKVFQNLHQFKGESGIGTWINRIVINQSLNYLRDQKKYALQMSLTPNIADETEDILVDADVQKYDVHSAIAMMNGLPESYRIIFNLYAIDGMSHAQIAEVLKISEANSRQMLMRARKMLKKELEKKITEVNRGKQNSY